MSILQAAAIFFLVALFMRVIIKSYNEDRDD